MDIEIEPHQIVLNCREIPVKKVVVFNDRAEVNRLAEIQLKEGQNAVLIKNISKKLIDDSIRIDGRGSAVIHEVLLQDKPALRDNIDSPQVAEVREKVRVKKDEVNEIEDLLKILATKNGGLDNLISEFASSTSKGNDFIINEEFLNSCDQLHSFYTSRSANIRSEIRKTKYIHENATKELKVLEAELKRLVHQDKAQSSRNIVVIIESNKGGPANLDIVYQVRGAKWSPSYDIRVDINETNNMKITYFAEVSQVSGEDWIEVPLVLSTVKPSLGGQIPELGCMEATLYKPPPAAPKGIRYKRKAMAMACPARRSRCAVLNDVIELDSDGASGESDESNEDMDDESEMLHASANVIDQTLSTEFEIVRPASIPSTPDSHKVTIGIIELHPQLVHECVPSQNTAVFLTAAAVNDSQLPILCGSASIFLNNAFVTKTQLKSVSRNERFSCSLGIDASVKVKYEPARKFTEHNGLLKQNSSVSTEQVINVKNTRASDVLLIVKEAIPRTTNEKIKIRIVQPPITENTRTPGTVNESPAVPEVGARLNEKNNLEWTVKLAAGQQENLKVHWIMEHPREERVEFNFAH